MKTEIHPKYYRERQVTCACGNTFTIGATKPEIRVEICAKCHPFYTGEKKLMITAGRVEKFKTRRAQASAETKPKKVPVRIYDRAHFFHDRVQVRAFIYIVAHSELP